MFSWQEQYLTCLLHSLVRYCSCHLNIKFISSGHRVISSIYSFKQFALNCFMIFVIVINQYWFGKPSYTVSTWIVCIKLEPEIHCKQATFPKNLSKVENHWINLEICQSIVVTQIQTSEWLSCSIYYCINMTLRQSSWEQNTYYYRLFLIIITNKLSKEGAVLPPKNKLCISNIFFQGTKSLSYIVRLHST